MRAAPFASTTAAVENARNNVAAQAERPRRRHLTRRNIFVPRYESAA